LPSLTYSSRASVPRAPGPLSTDRPRPAGRRARTATP
jgi:hypothetical protein